MQESQEQKPVAAEFVKSAHRVEALPIPDRPEVAFAGRSNAGKSSAINAICARRKLARTSKSPGRTQLINYFQRADGYLVDLPGYGFARVPPAVRAAWQTLMERYLVERESLRGVVLIMDARRPLTDFDVQLLEWGACVDLSFHLLLTKADKLPRNRQVNVLREVKQALPDHTVQLFSATQRIGVDQARAALSAWLETTLD